MSTRNIKIGLSAEDKLNMKNEILEDVKEETNDNFANLENEIRDDISEMHSTIQGLGNLEPSGTDTSTNILAFTENKGIYVATDTGGWYYWNGSAYVYGGVFQAPEIPDGSITEEKIANHNVTPEKLGEKKTSVNILNLENVKYNTMISINSSNQAIELSSDTWNTTDYLQAEALTLYSFKVYDFNDYSIGYRVIIYCFDENYTYLGKATNSGSVATQFESNYTKQMTTLANTNYIRVQYFATLNNYFQLQLMKNTDYSEVYEPYGDVFIPVTYAKQENLEALQEELNNKPTGTTIINFNNNYNYDLFNANSTKNGAFILSRLWHTSKSYKKLTENEVNLFQSGDTYGHDAQICYNDSLGKLYCVYVANQVTKGDSATDVNAFVRLQIMGASTSGVIDISNLITINVCKNGDIVSGKTIISGAGVPNCYLIGNILHIIWSSQCNDEKWYEMHCIYDCSNDVLGTPEICQMDNELMQHNTISKYVNNENSSNALVTGMISINASITELNGYYYACACCFNRWKNGVILRTQNFSTWEFVKEPSFNGIESNGNYEGAMGSINGYLYLALRQDDLDNMSDTNPMILAKLDSNGNVIDNIIIPSITSRPSFFKLGTKQLYLAYPNTNRLNTTILLVYDGKYAFVTNLRDAIPMQDIPTGGNYVQVCPRTENLQFVVRTQGSTGIRVSCMNGLEKHPNEIMTLFNNVFEL